PPQRYKRFWELPLHFPARNLGFRTFHQLLPSADRLAIMNIVNTKYCRLCEIAPDSLFHFTVGCPVRWSIWTELLTAYFPLHFLQPADIYEALTLQQFPSLPSLHNDLFLTVVFTGHWTIWRAYWQLHFDSTPVIPEAIVKQTVCLVA
ncbi:hypothetical protein EDC96DRAFT_418213, partial [Choanephora cucurbitarum]